MRQSLEKTGTGRIARNLGSAWLAYIVTIIGLFLVTPHVISAIGKQAYGVWVILQSAISFSGLFDLGFRSAVIRYVSRCEAAGDQDGVQENATAGLLYFSLVALIVFAIGCVAALLVREGISDRISPALGGVVVVLSAAAALNLPTSFFRGLLYARERIDLSNSISILGTVFKITLILLLVTAASGLRTLAWIELACQILLIGMTVLISSRIYKSIPFRLSAVRWHSWLEMWRYGGFTLLNQFNVRVREGAPPLLIGTILAAARVPEFSIAASLANYLAEIVARVGGVLTPSISRLEGRGELSNAAELVSRANRLSASLAGILGVGLLGMARPFLHIWLGPEFDNSYWLLIILAGSAVLGSAQMPTVAYFFGTGTHDRLMWLSLMEVVLVISLGAAGAVAFGVMGVAGGVLAASILPRLILRPFLFCRLAQVPARRFLIDYYSALVLFSLAATLAATVSGWGLRFKTYPEVFLLGILWAASYTLVVWVVYLRPVERAALLLAAVSGLRLILPRRSREVSRMR